MRIYLDDDIRDHLLVAFLTKDGHDVYLPAEEETGQHDAMHFLAAVTDERPSSPGITATTTRFIRSSSAAAAAISGFWRCAPTTTGCATCRPKKLPQLSPKSSNTA